MNELRWVEQAAMNWSQPNNMYTNAQDVYNNENKIVWNVLYKVQELRWVQPAAIKWLWPIHVVYQHTIYTKNEEKIFFDWMYFSDVDMSTACSHKIVLATKYVYTHTICMQKWKW